MCIRDRLLLHEELLDERLQLPVARDELGGELVDVELLGRRVQVAPDEVGVQPPRRAAIELA